MAEASPGGSSLSLTIDKSLLECSICCGPFNDPRSLPCLHPFCCGCLENWAKTCSKDKKSLSCPLCKKVYRIPPEEGIKGFPAHFLVADLQSCVEKASQLCEKHGEKKIYFCETCGSASCSDCTALDPVHQGHTFIRLNQTAEQQRRSLQNIVRKVQGVQQKCRAAIEQSKQVKLDLYQVSKEKIKTIDKAQDEYLQQGNHGNQKHVQQVKKLVKAYRQEVYHKRKVHREIFKQIQERLSSDLTEIGKSCEQATDVAKSGSDIDIISLYPSLSSTLEQLAQCQVSAIDSTLSQIDINAPQCASLDLTSLEQLLCNKLHIKVPSFSKIQARNRTIHPSSKPVKATRNPLVSSQPASPVVSTGSLSSSLPANYAGKNVATFSASTTTISRKGMRRLSSWFSCFCCFWSALGSFFCFMIALSLLIQFQCVPSVEHKMKLRKNMGQIKIEGVTDSLAFAVHSNGDFAVTSRHAPVAVFSPAGNFKFTINGSPAGTDCIAVTPNDHYVILGWHATELFSVYTYDSQGHLIEFTTPSDIRDKSLALAWMSTSVAVDSAGKLIVGLFDSKTVLIFLADGTISMFQTQAQPLSLTCAPDDRLIISYFDDETVRVIDRSGRHVSIIQPPPGDLPWEPFHVCCNKQGELFVATSMDPIIYLYQYVGGKFKYQYSIVFDELLMGIEFSADGKKLFVATITNIVIIFE